MKLGFLGMAGLAGLLGFWDPRFYGLFFLFFLVFIDIFPKKGMGLLKILLLILGVGIMSAGSVFRFMPVLVINWLALACILCYWALLLLYPAGKNGVGENSLSLLQDPLTRSPLLWEKKEGLEILKNPANGMEYPFVKGIPVFLDEAKLEGTNKKYFGLYNGFAYFYDLMQKLIYVLFFGGEKRKRMGFLKGLDVKAGEKVLETSVGTGGNFHYLPKGAECWGLDISSGMLSMCLKNMNRWGRKPLLVQAEAEALPFRDNSFDVVFQFGGINFFNDRKKAIDEMVRVAKPGARLMIGDETEQVAAGMKDLPGIAGKFYADNPSIYAPIDLIPEGMTDLKCEILYDGTLYFITFKKPV